MYRCWCGCRAICDAPEGTSWVRRGAVTPLMSPAAPVDPSGLHRAPDGLPAALWICCEQWNCWRAGSCGWGQRSKVSTPAARRWLNGAFISLWSWPFSWTSREQVWKMRWEADTHTCSQSQIHWCCFFHFHISQCIYMTLVFFLYSIPASVV